MSEVKKIATRESYGHALVELGKEHEEVVVLDADLAEATKTGIFKKEFPERHIDCGIAECNMMGIAVGLLQWQSAVCKFFAMFAQAVLLVKQYRLSAIEDWATQPLVKMVPHQQRGYCPDTSRVWLRSTLIYRKELL
ncbi:MAG: hypothetical protein ACLUI7_10370 [Coprococcus sp.]